MSFGPCSFGQGRSEVAGLSGPAAESVPADTDVLGQRVRDTQDLQSSLAHLKENSRNSHGLRQRPVSPVQPVAADVYGARLRATPKVEPHEENFPSLTLEVPGGQEVNEASESCTYSAATASEPGAGDLRRGESACQHLTENVEGEEEQSPISKGGPNDAQMARSSSYSFSTYLLSTSLKRLEEELHARTRRPEEIGSCFPAVDHVPDSPLGSFLLCTQFAKELGAYTEKMTMYQNMLTSAMDTDTGVIFDTTEKETINGLLRDIQTIVEKLYVTSKDTQKKLDAYNITAKMIVKKTSECEKRINHLTEVKEAAACSRREALLQTLIELGVEREMTKSILLKSGCREEGVTNAPRPICSVGIESADEDAPGGCLDCDFTVGNNVSPPPPPPPAAGAEENKQAGSALGAPLVWTPEGDDASRRNWICDHALGYFSDCKDPPAPECLCTMIARMQPHEMGNDVLRSRRQMSVVVRLIDRCPASREFRNVFLEKRMEAMKKIQIELERECFSLKERLFAEHCC
ncbi:hypothetical protein DQ04_03281070 [Trypanosoma grayi]|uniref:hypothetical protein n=1 Tax=Trypanosoma grayi TaxID=71804 RepID=UPI0004F4A662|nr:hypothetical protein DQ04_03281070 [Trypanosoma grayi]KEG10804.1 hypothetical protein DQ04_03281070 [Trypanosoma grayi]